MNQPIERIQRDRQARTQPALRLVDTRKIERADWLEVRKSGIGGSDAAAAVGLNPHKSALELWMEKTGRDAHLPQLDPTDTREPVFWGQLLEPIVAAAYTQQTGTRSMSNCAERRRQTRQRIVPVAKRKQQPERRPVPRRARRQRARSHTLA